MPANYPEIWLGTVKRLFNSLIAAAWLDGIPEIAADVTTINGGSATEKNIIYVPSTTFAAEVLVNNTTYPIDVQEFEDDTISLTLDKFQTKVTTLSDDQTKGSSYDKIVEVTKGHVEPLAQTKYVKALHAIAPQTNTARTPVILTTGDDDGTGRRRLTYDDLVRFKKAIDDTDCNPLGRRLVLCNDHWNDLLLDRKNFGDQFINYKTGSVLEVLGFTFYQWIQTPKYTSAGAKVAFGAVAPAGSRAASVFFQKDNIGKKTGNTTQYFLKAENNPRTQSNELNYRHYFVAMPFLNEYIGAIRSASVA
ncbi:hypothetical protein ACFOWM_06240 [Ferruginibacter yonginensis]|uniref:Major capsid protein n=1 Tax=Ferruginibacter yonginensis TaxID=1310416 RepID=A0ABV8QRM0_9BACT